jgi:hypothetical protein
MDRGYLSQWASREKSQSSVIVILGMSSQSLDMYDVRDNKRRTRTPEMPNSPNPHSLNTSDQEMKTFTC